MKIALLCPDASSNPLVRTYPVARVLQRRHELQVLGFRSGPEIFAPYRDSFEYETRLLRRMPGFLGQLRELASRVQADAVYAFKPLATSLWVGLLAKHTRRIPLFLDVEDWELGGYLDGTWRDRLHHLAHVERPDGLLWTLVSEGLARRADEVFVVSRSLQRRFGGTRLQAVGDSRARLLVVGAFRDEAYRRSLLERYPRSLVVLGPRPHDEMPLFLAIADVVALPQRVTRTTEAQVPGKIFEAMAMACPILATAVSDLPEILEGCGRITPAGSVDGLAQGLEALLGKRGEAVELGHEARRRCQRLYSWDAMEVTLHERLERWERKH